MHNLLLVMIGSAFGGGLRYMFSQWLPAAAGTFPFATFAVNILGCLVIGFVSGLNAAELSPLSLSPQARLLLTTGFCGGFTTFSTFSNETVALLRDGHAPLAILYVVLSILLGLAAALAGRTLGAHL